MAAKLRKLSCWAVLALFVALTAYGFDQAKLFRQDIWTPDGLRRFLIFAAGYWLCFALFAVWKRRVFFAFVLTAVLVYTILATGPLAVLAVILVVLSSLVLGQSILKRFGVPDQDAVTGILATVLGLSLFMFVLSIAALEPVNYPAAYLAAVAAPLIWQWRRSIAGLARIPRLWKPLPLSRAEQFAAAALIFVLMLDWLVVSSPRSAPTRCPYTWWFPNTCGWCIAGISMSPGICKPLCPRAPTGSTRCAIFWAAKRRRASST